MAQLEHIETIEKRLWSSADNLRANSNYASNEYFLPVMGLIFLRHAYSRYLAAREEIEARLPKRGGKLRPVTREDFARRIAIFLRPEARFDYLVELPDDKDRAQGIIDAMESIEEDYENLKGILPKSKYHELDNDVLRSLLRTFNDPALKEADGDVFGRIYEYFLTRFADLKAHDNGEFFTPVSLVQMIVTVIEPDHGRVLDPACGSGGMFVQSAHFIERMEKNPTEQVSFYGLEKNATTIRLARMNLAVHGLEGDIRKAITYYEDPHELLNKADFVMANPPFNVDEIDANKIKTDPRLPLGLPGVNKKGAVSNGNYVWISFFYSYLNEKGRGGFVMSSQASSAGRDEAKVRRKLVETGHVDVMIAIRSNFFYTRSVPCELWFIDRGKPDDLPDQPSPPTPLPEGEGSRSHQKIARLLPSHHGRGAGGEGQSSRPLNTKSKVLMIDARNIYRKVTRKINDFSPEQLKNVASIVWLYRGQPDRFLELVRSYVEQSLKLTENLDDYLSDFKAKVHLIIEPINRFLEKAGLDAANIELLRETDESIIRMDLTMQTLVRLAGQLRKRYQDTLKPDNKSLHEATEALVPMTESCRDLIKKMDLASKLTVRLTDYCEKELNARVSDHYTAREINKAKRALDEARKDAVERLRGVRYFYRQARWLQERFPEAKLRDVEGLGKLVSVDEIKRNDWSLTPGRYVGVALEEEDEDFDFEETLREIHVELQDLNREAAELSTKIAKNFEELGI